ncbi:protein phosphatase 2C domain-containing protein [Crossiella sp. CA198]|uniref:protein phosphatase 2C domain-containing protein n=1 Tax=Crossiella sp. CA198 TaxID=3455607 RepID=UPI003F8D09E9
MRTEIASVPGGGKPNEDWVGVTMRAAVLLDGLTAPGELGTGCIHGVPWYVDQLGAAIVSRMSNERVSLAEVLGQAIGHVAGLHEATCDLSSSGTPSATVSAVRIVAGQLEWLALADSVILIDTETGIQAITDGRVNDAATEQRDAALSLPVGSPEQSHEVSRLVSAQREVRNKPGGYWIASADSEAAREALVGQVPLSTVRRIVLLSDGAARPVEFGLSSWDELLATLVEVGPAGLIERVRNIENQDPQGKRWPRYKASDDATVAFIRFA